MTDGTAARYGGAAGIVFVLLIVVGFFISDPPALDASAQEVSNYFVDEQRTIQVQMLLIGASPFFLIWFLAGLRSALRAAEGGSGTLSEVAFGAGLIVAVLIVLTASLVAAVAFRPEETSPELTRALNDVAYLPFSVGGVAVAAMFTAAALASFRRDALPAWLGWLAAVVAVAQALAIGGIFEDTGVFSGEGLIGVLGLFGLLIWVAAASVVMLRGPQHAGAVGPASTR